MLLVRLDRKAEVAQVGNPQLENHVHRSVTHIFAWLLLYQSPGSCMPSTLHASMKMPDYTLRPPSSRTYRKLVRPQTPIGRSHLPISERVLIATSVRFANRCQVVLMTHDPSGYWAGVTGTSSVSFPALTTISRSPTRTP